MNKLHFTSIFAFLLPFLLFAEEGVVVIHQDSSITNNINANRNKKDATKDKAILTNGYCIQVYSDNHPSQAKKRTFKIKDLIKEDFPDEDTYIKFEAPFWKLYMGNFTTYHEALLFCRILKKELKELKNGIYIVEHEVEIVSLNQLINQAMEEDGILSTDSTLSTNPNQDEL